MSLWTNLAGTVLGYLRLGTSGVRIKNDAGKLAVRNSTDTADAEITAGGLRLATTMNGVLRANSGVVSAVAGSIVRVNTSNGHGSTNTGIRRFLNTVTNTGGEITYVDSATLGGSFTIGVTGTYAISYSDSFSGAHDFGISLNSTQLATAFAAIAVADRLNHGTTGAASFALTVSATLRLSAGDVIRAHTGGLGGGIADRTHFIITKVG